MQNFPKISAVILVVGLVASIYVSRRMNDERHELLGTNPAREELVYMPVMGMDKFWADIKWMQTINHLGRVRGKMDEEMTKFFVGQFQRITDLDPDFDMVYKVGAGSIAYQDVEAALNLIEKAEKYSTEGASEEEWKRPYYAAHWILQIKARTENDKEKKKEYQQTAIEHLKKAVDMSGPWYVENMLLHTQSKKQGVYGVPYKELKAWYEYYNDQIKKTQAEAPDAPDGEGAPAGESGGYAYAEEGGSPAMTRLRERIISRCRELMKEFLVEIKDPKANKKDIQDKMDYIRNKVFIKMNPDTHYSAVSLAAYGPGDMYDRVSGTPVVPYGIDLYAFEKEGLVVPVSSDGQYNPRTGEPVAADFETLKKFLKGDIKRLKPQYEVYMLQQKDEKKPAENG